MLILTVLLVLSSVTWCLSAVFLIYAIGTAILTLSVHMLLTALILFAFANAALFILGILND